MNARAGALLLAVALLATGCSSDEPSTREAGTRLAAWMRDLPAALGSGVAPLKPWRPSETARADHAAGCRDDQARRTYAATLDVPAHDTDPGNRGTLVAGQVGPQGWKVRFPVATAAHGGTVHAVRKGHDATGTRLNIRYAAVPGGWHYDVTAQTACLSTS